MHEADQAKITPRTLKQLAAAIRHRYPQYEVEIDKGYADVSRNISGHRFVAYNKVRHAGQLSVYATPRAGFAHPIFRLNLAETYRRVKDGVRWLNEHHPETN